jgi:hypothetical protein
MFIATPDVHNMFQNNFMDIRQVHVRQKAVSNLAEHRLFPHTG